MKMMKKEALKMEKKVLAIVLVLAFVSASYGDSSAFLSGGSGFVTVAPGDSIKVDLVADFPVDRVQIVSIVDTTAVAGVASSPALHAGFDWTSITSVGPLNQAGNLVEFVNGGVMTFAGSPKIAPGESLFSFDYLVPNALGMATIGPGAGVTASVSGTAPAPLEMNVVPEPMTVVLLGLGGLFLVRRK
jgi:hypothetical protein